MPTENGKRRRILYAQRNKTEAKIHHPQRLDLQCYLSQIGFYICSEINKLTLMLTLAHIEKKATEMESTTEMP